jgi:hypothetical protein
MLMLTEEPIGPEMRRVTRAYHQPPEVNYVDVLANVDIP